MSLKDKLVRLKKLKEKSTETDWDNYKANWKKDIDILLNTIQYKWFNDYLEEGLMEFSLTPIKRIDPHISGYFTQSLEITLSNNKYFVLEPITGITADYDGKLEFYMRGNVYKKATILRNVLTDDSCEWILAKSHHTEDHFKLNKTQIENLIEEWL